MASTKGITPQQMVQQSATIQDAPDVVVHIDGPDAQFVLGECQGAPPNPLESPIPERFGCQNHSWWFEGSRYEAGIQSSAATW